MNHKIKSIHIILILLFSSCSLKNNDIQEETALPLEEVIELTNYLECDVDGQIVKIGIPKLYYLKGEQPQLIIKNLPNKRYKIKLNGIEKNNLRKKGDYIFELNGNIQGWKANTIQIYDEAGTEVLNERMEHQIGTLQPSIKSEHGKYLFRGISTKIEIINLGMACPYFKLIPEGCEIRRKGDGTYNIKPDQSSDTALITLKFNNRSKELEYQILDPPPPKLKFKTNQELKCISLEPSKMFVDIKYSILKLRGVSYTDNARIDFENRECFPDKNNFKLYEIVYSIDNSNYIDTLRLQ